MNVTISYQRFACFGVSLELVTHLDSKTQASYNVKLSATSYGRKHTLRIWGEEFLNQSKQEQVAFSPLFSCKDF
jgi:hypothetical protein